VAVFFFAAPLVDIAAPGLAQTSTTTRGIAIQQVGTPHPAKHFPSFTILSSLSTHLHFFFSFLTVEMDVTVRSVRRFDWHRFRKVCFTPPDRSGLIHEHDLTSGVRHLSSLSNAGIFIIPSVSPAFSSFAVRFAAHMGRTPLASSVGNTSDFQNGLCTDYRGDASLRASIAFAHGTGCWIFRWCTFAGRRSGVLASFRLETIVS
jgi:hypothetical protein